MEGTDLVTQQPYSSKTGLASILHPGLQKLGTVQQFIVKQQRPKCLELLGCWEYNNRFSITDNLGNELYLAKEQSSCLMRSCCANLREFTMAVNLNDDESQEVLTFERPLNCLGCCSSCCYPSCMQSLTVKSGDAYIGKIIEYPTCWIKKLEIFNQDEEKIADVTGPCLIWRMGCNNMFSMTKEDIEIGHIEQVSRGLCTDVLTDTNSFHVEVPISFDPAEKALVIGATILLDIMFFEKSNNDNY